MITAIDTNILLDIFLPDPKFGIKSLSAVENASSTGGLVICNIVYAELVPQFKDKNILDLTLKKININVIPITNETCFLAGITWNKYRQSQKGKGSRRIITDFLIGAFACVQADRFLTRDRGFYRKYFSNIKIL